MMSDSQESHIPFSEAPTLPLDKGMMIAWRPECYRSTATARTFGVPIHFVWYTRKSGNKAVTLLKRYLYSIQRTIQLIRTHRPRTVIVYNLPPFLLLAAKFCRVYNRHNIVMDFHSGALSDSKWKIFRGLYRSTARQAPFTANHNRFDGKQIALWGGRPVHLIALPHNFPGIDIEPAPEKPTLLAVCSFNADEPIDILMKAFAKTPDIHFNVTGNYKKLGLDPKDCPPNVTLTGFLDYEDYLRLLAKSTAVITLSTRSHIMQMAVHEAISLGVPVVTNRSETLAEVLEGAGIFSDIEADSLAGAFSEAAARSKELRSIAGTLKQRRWEDLAAELSRIKGQIPSDLLAEKANAQ